MRDVILSKPAVELYKILKFEGLLSSGGEAKAAIDSGLVKVNGEVETRKRRQINAGDIIEIGGDKLQMRLG
ncbi:MULTISPECIES: RNA-binding S4 domain-containing protein [Rheinheimera]|jgi:ribosome-associated protein|uniref:Ribosome-associated protein n=1 Tax=Rheinheimera pacifica TaxID=173990 RepID=A0A1H6N420_9GAMM|nr:MULTISPECIES: RNA-binding S4 domain-containing protein [Rheinheimera]KUM54648.1 RNA-binding protein [Rheinheimera sp. EpRS3]PKM20900.1 MAG: RNA-binding S4 domain-containing protein [Gammaproteobacteria bacterium HGW-Gammaproteobacteria-15]SEI07061.1 ribosome-associated protein [Rheinheimera pacifica]